jgi:hypothetical protein
MSRFSWLPGFHGFPGVWGVRGFRTFRTFRGFRGFRDFVVRIVVNHDCGRRTERVE